MPASQRCARIRKTEKTVVGTPVAAKLVMLKVPQSLLASVPPDVYADEGARELYLHTALEIGIKALAQAGVSLDTSYVDATFQGFASEVRQYRDESQRTLEQLLRYHLTGEDSQLARMLLAELGERGRLASLLDNAHRRLADPEVQSSLPNVVAGLIRSALDDEHIRVERLVNAADPQSPLGLFLSQQQQAVKILQDEYTKKLFSLEKQLSRQMEEIRTALNFEERLAAMQDKVDDQIEKSTGKGAVFEGAGYDELVRIAAVFGDEVESCGTMLIDGTNRKIGDQLIHINQPGAPKLTIVVEQKAGKIGRKPLLRQMGDAMFYRSAEAVIGLMQRKHMAKNQSHYEQHGPVQIIVGVDWSRDASDWFALEVAYRTLRGHVVASALKGGDSAVDIEDAKARMGNIKDSLGDVTKVKVIVTSARKSLDTVTIVVTVMEERVRSELAAMERALQIS